jgi:hypothetical protein
MPRTPANALRGLASPTPSTLAAPMALCSLGSWVGGGHGWRLLCCRVCRCCCLLPEAGAGGFAPSSAHPRVTFRCLLGTQHSA